MSTRFLAVAIDFDGTLTETGRPSADVLVALNEVRQRDRRVVLVTGRILEELRAVFPDWADHFDLVVAENGAVVAAGTLDLRLCAKVPLEIDAALRTIDATFRRGQVILATHAEYEPAVADVLHNRGLDCQLVRNRGELMVVPAGVSKATGLRYALQRLDVSPHNTIAIGDAENDLSMLAMCEMGVAVANAIDSVAAQADVRLAEPDGAGVARFLWDTVLRDDVRLQPRRWRLPLGHAPDGSPVSLPASQTDILIVGGPGSGKSYAAGLIAEQLVQLGYVVCVFDPEGDHAPLGHLPSVVTLGGRDRLPAIEDVARIFEHGGTSVVVDLTLVSPTVRDEWTCGALRFLERRRARTGVPHWMIIDEAHAPLGEDAGGECLDREQKGHCVVTYRPDRLAQPIVADGADCTLLVAGEDGIDRASASALCSATGLSIDALRPHLSAVGVGEALVVTGRNPPAIQHVAFAPRSVPHMRHWHKYEDVHLPVGLRFYFRGPNGLTGAVAGSLTELHHGLRAASLEVLRHHARGRDFSRWVSDVLRDAPLASALRIGERSLRTVASDADAQTARSALLAAIEGRYPLDQG